MIKIAHLHQLNKARDLHKEIANTIREAVTILDNEYGENRNIDQDYGGFVLVIESMEEINHLKQINLELEQALPEYIDVIHIPDGNAYTSSLILQGNDFGIVLIMPIEILLATNLKKYLEGDKKHD